MTARKINKIPGPLYAAAGAGDLAYEKLRSLPERVTGLRGRVSELRPAVEEKVRGADFDRWREVARRNARTVASHAHKAHGRASAVYGDLVARGERVVQTARSERAADMRMDEPESQPASEAATVEVIQAKPEKKPAEVKPAEVESPVESPAQAKPQAKKPAAKPAKPAQKQAAE